MTTSATSIAENAGSALTLTATIGNATFEDVTVSIMEQRYCREGTDFGTVSDITISAGNNRNNFLLQPMIVFMMLHLMKQQVYLFPSYWGGASENGDQSVTITITDNGQHQH